MEATIGAILDGDKTFDGINNFGVKSRYQPAS
jgi:hypothetical protein